VAADAGAVLSKVSLNAKPDIGRKVDRLWAAIVSPSSESPEPAS
jgi:hypothetical protein